MALALDDSLHAWRHADGAPVKILPDGSSRTKRMPALGEQGMTAAQVHDPVDCLKSHWGERALACQGPKHMQCSR